MIKIENVALKLNVRNQIISTAVSRIVSDSVNVVKAVFTFDSYWDGYAKTAVFTNGDVSKQVLLNTDTVTIPWECLVTGRLKISVVGVIENPYSRITTKEMGTGISVVQCGDLTGDNAAEPTATVVEQLTTKIDSANTNADTALNVANNLQNTISSSVTTATEQATIAANKATEATAQTEIATNKASEALASANSASASETNALEGANTATQAATTATEQANIATNKAAEATAQTEIATNKASEALASANSASASETNALEGANTATQAATTATTQASTATARAALAQIAADTATAKAAEISSSAAKIDAAMPASNFTGANILSKMAAAGSILPVANGGTELTTLSSFFKEKAAITGVDANAYIETGIYKCIGNITNLPNGESNFGLIFIYQYTGYVMQMFYPTPAGFQHLWKRTSMTSGSTWTDWSEMIDAGNLVEYVEADFKISDLQAFVGYSDTDIYGVETDMENKTFTRLAGAVGKTGGSDFDAVNAFGGRKRCILTDSGVRLAYYGEAAYTETGALTQEIIKDGVTYPVGTIVQVMVEQPKFYYKVVPLKLEKIAGGKGYHLRKARYYISDTYRIGFKVHPAFISNGIEKKYIYLSAYEGSLYDVSALAYIANDSQVADFTSGTGDKLCSIANVKPSSGSSQKLTRANVRTIAHNRGSGWEQAYAATVSATQILFLIEYASFNSQSKIGNGVTNKTDDTASNMSEPTGATTLLGNASGSAANGSISYRGEENFWMNIWKFVDGLNIEAKNMNNLYVADNSFADDIGTSPYKDAGITITRSNGYISAFGYNEEFDWLFFPSETVGDSSLPVGDYLYQNHTYNGWFIALLGGYWAHSSYGGGFCWHVSNASSDRARNIGGRLVYVPQSLAT